MGSQGPEGRIPFSMGIKWTLAFLAALSAVSLGFEIISLQNPEDPSRIAPISWAFWWLGENTGPWFFIAMATFTGAFGSHLFWYRRKGDFWYPSKWWHVALIAVSSLVPLIFIKSWMLLAAGVAIEGAAVLAHRYWYRLERFDDHLARFHDD